MRIVVEYEVNISQTAKDFIKKMCTPSMWCNDTEQYCLEDLLDYIRQEEHEDKFEKEDLIELNRLMGEDVSYIEF